MDKSLKVLLTLFVLTALFFVVFKYYINAPVKKSPIAEDVQVVPKIEEKASIDPVSNGRLVKSYEHSTAYGSLMNYYGENIDILKSMLYAKGCGMASNKELIDMGYNPSNSFMAAKQFDNGEVVIFGVQTSNNERKADWVMVDCYLEFGKTIVEDFKHYGYTLYDKKGYTDKGTEVKEYKYKKTIDGKSHKATIQIFTPQKKDEAWINVKYTSI